MHIKYCPSRVEARNRAVQYVQFMRQHKINTSCGRVVVSKEGCKDECVVCD